MTVACARPNLFTARLTIAVKPDPRGRIRLAAFHPGITVTEILRDLLSCQFPDNAGDAP
jgi:hypothetical protein